MINIRKNIPASPQDLTQARMNLLYVLEKRAGQLRALRRETYQKAQSLYSLSKYDEALPLFRKLGCYRDSLELALKCQERTAAAAPKQKIFDKALSLTYVDDLEAARLFLSLDDYNNSPAMARTCFSRAGRKLLDAKKYAEAREALAQAGSAMGAREMLRECDYHLALKDMEAKRWADALQRFETLGGYQDSVSRAAACRASLKAEQDAARKRAAEERAAQEQKRKLEETARQEQERLRKAAEEEARRREAARQEEEAKARKKARKRKRRLIRLIAAALLAAAAAVFILVIYPKILYRQGEEQLAAKKWREAIASFEKLGDYEDSADRARQAYANLYAEQGATRQMADVYQSLPEQYQDHKAELDALYEQASAALAQGDFTAAAAGYAQLGSWKDAPAQALEAAYRSADAQQSAGQFAEAQAGFRAIPGYRDSDTRAQQAAADERWAQGDRAAAWEIYAGIPETYQSHLADYAAAYADAEALRGQGRYAEALAAFTALGQYSDSPQQQLETRYQEAASLAQAGSFEDAAAIYGALGGYQDSASRASMAQADAHWAAGDPAAAWEIYDTLDAAYRDHAADFAETFAAAEALEAEGALEQAADTFASLGSYNGANARAQQANYALAGQLAQEGRYAEAAARYARFMDYEDSREQHYQLGLAARRNHELEQAAEILSRDPDYRDARKALHSTAVDAAEAGLHETAVAAFTLLGDFEDSAARLPGETYALAAQLTERGEYVRAAELFESLGEHTDAADRAKACRYQSAKQLYEAGSLAEAETVFTALGDYEDSAALAQDCRYRQAKALLTAGTLEDAAAAFEALGDYGDSAALAQQASAELLWNAGDKAGAWALYAPLGEAYQSHSADYAADYAAAAQELASGANADAMAHFAALGQYRDSPAQVQAAAYARAQELLAAQQWADARALFESLGDYSDSADLMLECDYQPAMIHMQKREYAEALPLFDALGDYKNSAACAQQCRYENALSLQIAKRYEDALESFLALGNYRDSTNRARDCRYEMNLAAEAAAQTLDDYRDVLAVWEEIGGEKGYRQSQRQIQGCHLKRGKLLEDASRLEEAYQEYVLAGDYPNAAAKARETAGRIGEGLIAADDLAGGLDWLVAAEASERILALGAEAFDARDYDRAEAILTRITGEEAAQQRLYEMAQYYDDIGDTERSTRLYGACGDYADAARRYADRNRPLAAQTLADARQAVAEERYADARALYAEARRIYDPLRDEAENAALVEAIDAETAEITEERLAQKQAEAERMRILSGAETQLAAARQAVAEERYPDARAAYAEARAGYAVYPEDPACREAIAAIDAETAEITEERLARKRAEAERLATLTAAAQSLADARQAVTEERYADARAAFAAAREGYAAYAAEPDSAARLAEIGAELSEISEERLAQKREAARLKQIQESAASEAAQGDTALQAQDYAAAAEHYEQALQLLSDPAATADMRAEAERVNAALAEVQVRLNSLGAITTPGTVVDFARRFWIILDSAPGRTLLLAEEPLDEPISYHERGGKVTWEESSAREWLQTKALPELFTRQEREWLLPVTVDNSAAQQQDKTANGSETEDTLFLLSYAELNRYLPDPASREVSLIGVGACDWWLRSPGSAAGQQAVVGAGGKLDQSPANRANYLRPAVWVTWEALGYEP
ncbi:MAG: hypothetical protein IKH38_01395 [Clostridia bacterium]|nr:hypothetical protein [Clostridia bacterium]